MENKPTQFKTIGLAARSRLDRRGLSILKRVNTFLKKRELTVLYEKHAAEHLKERSRNSEDIMKKADLVVSIGGDGTIIRLAQHTDYKVTPIFSVNLGTLGFLTEVKKPERTLEVLKKVLSERCHLDQRALLRVTVYRKNKKIKTFLCLNDAVINQGNFARLIQMTATLNQRKMVRFKADGVIVATTTGSTAHSLSAGGPIVHPKLEALIFTPICPAKLSMRPIVIPSSRQLNITIETKRRFKDNTIALTLDGQQTFALEYGDQVKIRRSHRSLYLARLSNTRYYKVLRNQLDWGE